MKCFSLFSGIGGFDLAAKRLGHEIVGACEIDRYARTVYARHFPGVKIHEDATKINPNNLSDFDILVAGFPCQAFSVAGKRRGFEDTRGTLFFEIARIAKQKQPQYMLLENVKGLLSNERGKTVRKIYQTLMNWVMTQNHVLLTLRTSYHRIGNAYSLSQLLEEKVDEKYFLSEKALKGIMSHDQKHKKKGNGFKIRLLELSMPTTTKDMVQEQ